MSSNDLWKRVASRVDTTIKQVQEGDYSESLIHLSTVYGILSIGYYAYERSLVSDDAYDRLCKHLLENYDAAMAQGTYGTILQRGMLEAGSGYHFSSQDNLPPSAVGLFNIYKHITAPEYVAPTPARKRQRPLNVVQVTHTN